jgi:ferredoxin--NADP+ reductase
LPDSAKKGHLVAVIGAGPAGLYAAQYLARKGVQVVLFNRDIRPGGLAEYGIFPDKHKVRQGLKAQFQRILRMPEVTYIGNVIVGQSGDIRLDQLRHAGFQAIMVTTGAQKNHWLGLPGEDLAGVYQANDIVFHYNHLPSCEKKSYNFGSQVAVIGAGNVMLDIVRYLKLKGNTGVVTAFARRGPTEVKFDKETLEPVAECLDMEAIRAEVEFVQPVTERIGRDVITFFQLLANARNRVSRCESGITIRFKFLRTPKRLVGDDNGRVKAIVFEINDLVLVGDRVVAQGTGQMEAIPVDTVIFSIGSRVDEGFGLPTSHGTYVTTDQPRFPIDGISYEVYNPDLCANCEDIFVSGWARLPSEGIVGLAKKDAERGARAVNSYLETLQLPDSTTVQDALDRLPQLDKPVVRLEGLERLWAADKKFALARGIDDFRFETQTEMLDVIEDKT